MNTPLNTPLFLSGNEAVALSCEYAKVCLATGYPGTPSTEIIETIQKKSQTINTQWSINEKVALETAIGSCFSGNRSIAVMKHVGLNVAADPLMTFSYTGVNAGCVVISCDDPNMFSSQNEQDNRNYAKFSKIPMLEPSDSQEAFDFFLLAIEISEQYDTPVLFRMTTRICHSKTIVNLPEKIVDKKKDDLVEKKKFKPLEKYIMLPSIARSRHFVVEKRLLELKKKSEQTEINFFEENQKKKNTLIITSGISYQYVKESLGDYSIFKVGFSYPAPTQKIKQIAKDYKKVICIEELDPFLEEQLLAEKLAEKVDVEKRYFTFYCGELSPDRVKKIVADNYEEEPQFSINQSQSKPALCSGCSHLTIANLLRNLNFQVSGDIGCYTLAAIPPFDAIHSVIDMGASIPVLNGMLQKSKGDDENKNIKKNIKKKIAIIGDSTFLHSGITGLIDLKKHLDNGIVCLLDNEVTAMTGRQDHPGVGEQKIDYTKLAEAIGIKNIYQADPYDYSQCQFILEKSIENKELTFIIFKRGCALATKYQAEKVTVLDSCVKCGECLKVGCPSISFNDKIGHPVVNQQSCIGCSICLDSCEFDSLKLLSKIPQTDQEKKEKQKRDVELLSVRKQKLLEKQTIRGDFEK